MIQLQLNSVLIVLFQEHYPCEGAVVEIEVLSFPFASSDAHCYAAQVCGLSAASDEAMIPGQGEG